MVASLYWVFKYLPGVVADYKAKNGDVSLSRIDRGRAVCRGCAGGMCVFGPAVVWLWMVQGGGVSFSSG